MAGSFQHDPLDLQRNQIRLLRVSKSHEDPGKIACDIAIFEIESCPKYEALSYTWGPPSTTAFISLNGMPFPIRQNLWDFLDYCAQSLIISSSVRRRRRARGLLKRPDIERLIYHPMYLWIDQLCIDQSSVSERNHQVGRMADIYSKAQRVIVWLGKDGGDSVAAMEWIDQAAARHPGDLAAMMLKNESRDQAAMKSVEKLYIRPYWGRLWIAQEFLLPRHLLIICGSRCTTFEKWYSAWRYFGKYYRRPRYGLHKHHRRHWEIICGRFWRHQYNRPEKLCRVLSSFHFLECSDMRDKIYGLLSLVNQEERITVDYSEEARVVFWRAIAAIKAESLSSSEGLGLLRLGFEIGVTGEELDQKFDEKDKAIQNFQLLFAAPGTKYYGLVSRIGSSDSSNCAWEWWWSRRC